MKPLEFYFDYISPYAYFSWLRIEKFCLDHDLDLVIKPVVFGKLLDHWGQLGPAEIPPKREGTFKYCLFYAESNKLPLAFPKYHPFKSLSALRASLDIVSGEHQTKLISAIFHAGWGEGQDIGSTDVISNIAFSIGLDGAALRENIGRAEAKEALRSNTAEAIEKGVYGVPTMKYGDELFWGNDQFEFLSQVVKGTYQTNDALYLDVINRPRGIDRVKPI